MNITTLIQKEITPAFNRDGLPRFVNLFFFDYDKFYQTYISQTKLGALIRQESDEAKQAKLQDKINNLIDLEYQLSTASDEYKKLRNFMQLHALDDKLDNLSKECLKNAIAFKKSSAVQFDKVKDAGIKDLADLAGEFLPNPQDYQILTGEKGIKLADDVVKIMFLDACNFLLGEKYRQFSGFGVDFESLCPIA